MNQKLYLRFIDYNNAFDRVRYDQLVILLKEKNLYYGQRAVVQIDQKTTEAIEIKRGVRQGCVVSPFLFNMYSEDILNKALADQEHGIKINGISINILRYAGGTVLITGTLQHLQVLINAVVGVSEEYGLTLNINKTKFMLVTKSDHNIENIYIHNRPIEKVTKYNYLGTLFKQIVDSSQEIKVRLEKPGLHL